MTSTFGVDVIGSPLISGDNTRGLSTGYAQIGMMTVSAWREREIGCHGGCLSAARISSGCWKSQVIAQAFDLVMAHIVVTLASPKRGVPAQVKSGFNAASSDW
jgi:hypothetical protein